MASQNPPCVKKYHQGNLVSLPLCVFSSVPELFLNSIWLPAQTEDDKPQHPYFVVFRIYQSANRGEAATMFSSAPLPQLHCKLFAKMGDDRPFVCSAPGCGQVSLLHTSPAHAERWGSWVDFSFVGNGWAVYLRSPPRVEVPASCQFVLRDAAVSFSSDSVDAPVSNQHSYCFSPSLLTLAPADTGLSRASDSAECQ